VIKINLKEFLKIVYEDSYKIVGVLILLFILVLIILWTIALLVPFIH